MVVFVVDIGVVDWSEVDVDAGDDAAGIGSDGIEWMVGLIDGLRHCPSFNFGLIIGLLLSFVFC